MSKAFEEAKEARENADLNLFRTISNLEFALMQVKRILEAHSFRLENEVVLENESKELAECIGEILEAHERRSDAADAEMTEAYRILNQQEQNDED